MTVTILVVEDNAANMKLALILLNKAGMKAICATNATDGIALARAHSPDLILMDIQLPGMDGLTAVGILKSDPATADIPVIALTALAMPDDQKKIRAGGFTDYLAKPFHYQDLLDRIDKALPDKNILTHAFGGMPKTN
jgi:two-component system cell cycle response regulator DivK